LSALLINSLASLDQEFVLACDIRISQCHNKSRSFDGYEWLTIYKSDKEIVAYFFESLHSRKLKPLQVGIIRVDLRFKREL